MRVSILTQPLGSNYGGLLQAYALQAVLKSRGIIVETLNRRKEISMGLRAAIKLKWMIKTFVAFIGVKKYQQAPYNLYSKLESFNLHFISMSPVIDSDKKIRAYYAREKFDALIVGSDQVWRPRYSPKLENFFFDFYDNLSLSAKRIAYAASFGVDTYEFSEKEILICRPLAKKFDAISVREVSGLNLVKDYFDLSAEVVLDPTLLIDSKDYDYIIERDSSKSFQINDGLMAYFLDIDAKKVSLVNDVSCSLRLPASYLMNLPDSDGSQKLLQNNIYPSVGEWLSSFKAAKFVITDSFHGCVFSIIFKKPFLVVGNSSRGFARFTSLLSIFEIENRLIDNIDKFDKSILSDTIDWERIDGLMLKIREKSINFIMSNLTK